MEKHKIDVQSFSIIPVQSGIEVDTPDGRGTYEGITSSGIVTVFIDGGMRQYSWSDVVPDLTLNQMLLIDDLRDNLIEHIFRTKILPRAAGKI